MKETKRHIMAFFGELLFHVQFHALIGFFKYLILFTLALCARLCHPSQCIELNRPLCDFAPPLNIQGMFGVMDDFNWKTTKEVGEV